MSTDESNAALRGSESNDLLGPLVDAAMAAAKEVAYGTCATGANHLEGDYGTWDDWADLVERVAAQAVAAERERWRTLLADVNKQTRHNDYDWPACLQQEVDEALKA